MKLAILDDWFDTLRGLPCFARLDAIDVTIFTDHEPDVDRLAAVSYTHLTLPTINWV